MTPFARARAHCRWAAFAAFLEIANSDWTAALVGELLQLAYQEVPA